MEPTLYNLLGVPSDADQTTIVQAYEACLAAANINPTINVPALVQAYSVLSTAGQRAAYDFALHHATEEHKGYDAIYEVVVSEEEAQRGAIRTLTFYRDNGWRDDVVTYIPPGTFDGLAIRHPGKGGPSRDRLHHGNLIVVVRIRAA